MAETCKDKVCPRLSAPVFVPNLGIQLHEVKCIEHRCAHYQQLIGVHPQTGEHLSHWDCSFNWQNILTIENSKEVRQGAAATESLRNENVSIGSALSRVIKEHENTVPSNSVHRNSLPRSSISSKRKQ